jgi:KaiC/GvpD/RAD55 family RecA-like ATPase
MADKVPTGIEKLDAVTSGGLNKGSIMLLIGEPGTSKTTLVRQFVYEGLNKGENCVYLMTNRSLDHVLTSMSRAGYDVSENPNLKFLLYNGVATKRYKCFVGNFEDLIDVAYNCERIVSALPPGTVRMVIDDFSYLFLVNSKEVIFKFLNRISQILRQNDATCIIEVQRGMLDPQIVTAIESLTDGTIETRQEGSKRSFRVSRMEDETVKNTWIDLSASSTVGISPEAEKTLDEWENVLKEKSDAREEVRVNEMLKDMKKIDTVRNAEPVQKKKGLFGFMK